MQAKTIDRLPIALAICAVIAAIAIWIIAAGPAGASAGFEPQLTDSAPIAKVAVADVAPYTAAATPKRATAIAPTVKSAKRMTVSRPTATVRTASTSTGELATARRILAGYKAKYPILRGATVEFGNARGYQAISYYTSGRIVISRNHSASLSRIIGHEIWHVIDWRDNGKINWGERVPPR